MPENLYVVRQPDKVPGIGAVALNMNWITEGARLRYADGLDWVMRRFKCHDEGARCLSGLYRNAFIPHELLSSAATVVYGKHPSPQLQRVLEAQYTERQNSSNNDFVQSINNAFIAHRTAFRRRMLLDAEGIIVDGFAPSGENKLQIKPLYHLSNRYHLRPENIAIAERDNLTHFALQFELEWQRINGELRPRLTGEQFALLGGIGLAEIFVPFLKVNNQ